MNLTDEQRLIVMTSQLHRTVPVQFREFLEALVAYTNHEKDQVLSASQDRLAVAQGRAQALRDLCKMLADAHGKAPKIEEMSRGR